MNIKPGDIIIAGREKKNWTQEELLAHLNTTDIAQKMDGISLSYLQGFEDNSLLPSPKLAEALCDLMDLEKNSRKILIEVAIKNAEDRTDPLPQGVNPRLDEIMDELNREIPEVFQALADSDYIGSNS